MSLRYCLALNTFWAWFQSWEAQLDRIGDRILGGDSDRDLVWDLPWNLQEAVSEHHNMHNTTPSLSPFLSLSLPPKDGNSHEVEFSRRQEQVVV